LNKLFLHIIFLLSLNYFSLISFAQDTIPPSLKTNSNGLQFSFKKSYVEFSKGEMISNVLAVHNQKNIPVKFYTGVSIPSNWKAFSKKEHLYELAPGDSLFIPVHILPKVNLRGSTKFLFTVYVYSENNEPYGFTYFFGVIKKHISWKLTSSENKVYLLNGQTSVPFNITLMNDGTDEQDIHLSLSSLSKSVSLLDSSGKEKALLPVTLNLQAQKDTVFNYTFSKQVEPKNFRLVDIEGYNPYSVGEERKYYVTANSTSPNPGDYNKFRAGQKINFVQLSDNWEVNHYGTDVFPILVDLNAFNILGAQPMLNLTLQGQTFLNETSSIVYNSQLTYFSNFFTTNPYQNATLYLGYFHSKFDVQFGNITGGVLGTYQNGQGLKADYYISKNQRIGAFYTTSPRLFSKNPDYTTFGLTHNYRNSILSINSQFGHSISNVQRTFTDVLNVNASTNFIKNHTFGIRAGVSRNVKQDSVVVKYGWMGGVYYNGSYLHQKMNSNLSAMYLSPTFGIYSYERLTVNAGNQYHLNKKWNIYLNNNLYRYPDQPLTIYKDNYQLNNRLNFNYMNSKAGNFTPFAFYNFSRIQDFRVHSRGLGLNLGKYNLNENYHYFINILSGYNRALAPISKDYFFLQFAGFIQVRTLSFMTRYQLGNQNVSRNYFLYNSVKNPQIIVLTLRHQYVFPLPAFVMQNAVSYSYSTISGKNINFTPELYCFTKGGWRFRILCEINFSLNANSDIRETYYMLHGNEEISQLQWNKSFYLGVGIRKEFGIPIPKTKKKYCTAEFVAFYDINGNGKREHNEDLLENVVIKVEAWEVITNIDGEATLKNVPLGTYPFNVFSIPDLHGWFPHVDDKLNFWKSEKIYVPFERGVKVTGKVFLDREKLGADADKLLDLSRIKISAVNERTFTTLTSFNGSFEIYVPMGKYILTMDEKVLGDRFQLLQNNFELNIDDKFDNLFVPFYVIEKRRKVKVIKFDSNGNRIDVNEPTLQQPNEPTVPVEKPQEKPVNLNEKYKDIDVSELDSIINVFLSKYELTPEKRLYLDSLIDMFFPKNELPAHKKFYLDSLVDVFNSKNEPQPKKFQQEPLNNYNYADMLDIKGLDSLIDVLLSKTKPVIPFTNSELERIERSKIKKSDLSKYGDAVVYTIQIGAYKKEELTSTVLAKFLTLGKVESFTDDKGVTKYFVGIYNSIDEAKTAKKEISKAGFKDAFVIAIYNGKIITTKEAEFINE